VHAGVNEVHDRLSLDAFRVRMRVHATQS
jgi:hypothetical protein